MLREQIAKLQADQGALLKSQQEQLSALQKKLAEETKTAEPAAPQSAAADSGTTSRVVGVEPPKSGVEPARGPSRQAARPNRDLRIDSAIASAERRASRARHKGRRDRKQGHRRARAGN